MYTTDFLVLCLFWCLYCPQDCSARLHRVRMVKCLLPVIPKSPRPEKGLHPPCRWHVGPDLACCVLICKKKMKLAKTMHLSILEKCCRLTLSLFGGTTRASRDKGVLILWCTWCLIRINTERPSKKSSNFDFSNVLSSFLVLDFKASFSFQNSTNGNFSKAELKP